MLKSDVFSVITTLLATRLYQGLIFNGIWQTKLKFNFNKLVTEYPSKGAPAKMFQYYKQNNNINCISCTNMSKIIFKISTLFFKCWFKCYFWIPHPKLNNSTNFHKNLWNKTQNMNENLLPRFPRWQPRGRKEKDCCPNF